MAANSPCIPGYSIWLWLSVVFQRWIFLLQQTIPNYQGCSCACLITREGVDAFSSPWMCNLAYAFPSLLSLKTHDWKTNGSSCPAILAEMPMVSSAVHLSVRPLVRISLIPCLLSQGVFTHLNHQTVSSHMVIERQMFQHLVCSSEDILTLFFYRGKHHASNDKNQ